MEAEKKEKKPFLTYEKQVEKLELEKGLNIISTEYAIHLLKEHSYFALISGYKSPFKDKDGKYKLHTSIEDIYHLYDFDEKLRALFLRHILKVEKHIKSLISYSFCETYGSEQCHYLNATNYNYTTYQREINQLIAQLTEIEANPKQYHYILHQKNSHGNVPLWVMMKAVTLGTVSKMYSFLPQNIQIQVSKEFEFINEGMMVKMLDHLSRIRNICAHNERLYNYAYRKRTISDTPLHKSMQLPRKNGAYIKGKNDLFATVIVLKYMLKETDFCNLINDLDVLLNDLCANTHNLEQTQMYKYMGFPENWKTIKDCTKN